MILWVTKPPHNIPCLYTAQQPTSPYYNHKCVYHRAWFVVHSKMRGRRKQWTNKQRQLPGQLVHPEWVRGMAGVKVSSPIVSSKTHWPLMAIYSRLREDGHFFIHRPGTNTQSYTHSEILRIRLFFNKCVSNPVLASANLNFEFGNCTHNMHTAVMDSCWTMRNTRVYTCNSALPYSTRTLLKACLHLVARMTTMLSSASVLASVVERSYTTTV